MKLVNEVFPIRPEFLSNPIVAAFENINFGAHPVLSILNMGLCENFDGQFNFYADCCSTAVAKVEDAFTEDFKEGVIAYSEKIVGHNFKGK